MIKTYLYLVIFIYNIKIILTQLFYGKKFKESEEQLSDLKLSMKIDKAIYRNNSNYNILSSLRKYTFIESKKNIIEDEKSLRYINLEMPTIKSVKVRTDKTLNKPTIVNVPLKKPTVAKKKNKLVELNKQLDELLDKENYEEASKIRDLIENIKNNQKSE